MSYSEVKVAFKAEEHAAAKAADQIYEEISEALADGLQPTDVVVVAGIVQPSAKLWAYLAGASKQEFASRLIAIGVMLARDNWPEDVPVPE